MKRNILLLISIGAIVLSVWGCKGKAPGPSDTRDAVGTEADRVEDASGDGAAGATADGSTDRIVISQEKSDPNGEETGSVEGSAAFSFADLKGWEFLFASGAGGWGTTLMIGADGSFSGNYSDSDMVTGEGYPNGSYTWSDLSGRFTQPVKKCVGAYREAGAKHSFYLETIWKLLFCASFFSSIHLPLWGRGPASIFFFPHL